ncbi:MAG: tRNA (5-methylaminomethyl-2-thiouridylate)-methyltransferase [Fluviicola sp.]|jgi:tRNA-specific 2-thiouridylase|uniref:tRNA 2-thiouridine(34) synthase MnmA n=1 Tax=Fluviicola sp. TaxID=1917219 RepID=UPI002609B774|nr:tRNA 2-thiouridine(34) synthase MnmA [Fluviicola sp.]MDF3026362.1 tRNA (5-methylaminomethyl-2-thiouridylate)-methyltransferase [Fluviicola sp.]
MKRVVVGLSGGVDSSVSAYLLQQEGYEVIGLFMRNWHDETVTLSNDCPWIDDSNDALLVAEHLGIPFQVLDLSKEYKERIVDYMFAEYEAGRTPNPDVLCNREIKFDVFLKAAMELGADYVATGHYCRKSTSEDGIHHLLAGLDPNKDQSYFLCQLSQEQLSKALFPIGNLQKSEVRAIAKEIGLVTAEKKDSQGLCFVGKISLPEFLQQKLEVKYGKIIEINELESQYIDYSNIPVDLNHVVELSKEFIYSPNMGQEVEKHIGAHYYTIGQRKGLHIGGRPNPSFVIGIDTQTNTVYSGQKDDHPGLNKWALKIETSEMHWINPLFEMSIGDVKDFDIRIRYRQPLQKGTLTRLEDGFYILFNKKQRGIAPGQFAAFYLEDELIGSGIISH